MLAQQILEGLMVCFLPLFHMAGLTKPVRHNTAAPGWEAAAAPWLLYVGVGEKM